MVKRAKVTADTFEKKPNALDKLVGNTRTEPEREESRVETETQPEKAVGQRTYKPTSFYLDDNQLEKLDELALAYKKRTGKRINRNDIVRALVDETGLEEIVRLIRAE
jgi:hypothetical protein